MFDGGVEFDKIFQKDYFEDVIAPPDSSTGGLSSIMSSPQKTIPNINHLSSLQGSIRSSNQQQQKQLMQKQSKSKNQNNIVTSIKQDESILDSMNQLLLAVNQLKIGNSTLTPQDTAPTNIIINQTNKKNQQAIPHQQNIYNQKTINTSMNANTAVNTNTMVQGGAGDLTPTSLSKYLNSAFAYQQSNFQDREDIRRKAEEEFNRTYRQQNRNNNNNTSNGYVNGFNTRVQERMSHSPANVEQNNQEMGQMRMINMFRTQNVSQTQQNTTTNSTTTPKSPNRIGLVNKQAALSKTSTSKSKNRTPSPLSHIRTKTSSFISKTDNQRQQDTSVNSGSRDLSQDVINRLFLNHKKTQELKEKKRYVQYQKEIDVLQDKPIISDRSQRIVMNSVRQLKPIYSPERYHQELQNMKLKKESALKQKEMNEREKQIAEEQEIMRHSIHSQDKKLNMNDFMRKYDNQIRQYEARKNKEHQQSLQPYNTVNNQQLDDSTQQQQPYFKPEINKRSRKLAQDVEKIEKRMSMLQEDQKKKIEVLKQQLQPTFTPRINKNNNDKGISNENTIRNKPLNKQNSEMRSNRSASPLTQKVNHSISGNIGGVKDLKKIPLQKDYSQGPKLSNSRSSPGILEKSPSSTRIIQKNNFNKTQQTQPKSRNQIMSTLQSQEWIQRKTMSPTQNQSSQPSPLRYKQSIEKSTNHLQSLLQTMSKPMEGEQLDILKEYMKLKDQMNESLSNRTSLAQLNPVHLSKANSIPASHQYSQSQSIKPQQTQPNQQQFQKIQKKPQQQQSMMYKQNLMQGAISPIKKAQQVQMQNDTTILVSSPSQFNTSNEEMKVREFDIMMSQDSEQMKSLRKSGIGIYQSNGHQIRSFDVRSSLTNEQE